MHDLFRGALPEQYFAPPPRTAFGAPLEPDDTAELERLMEVHGDRLAALILEPIVQGAGGMRFYSAEYLRAARALCDRRGLLLIADEIATGFGRTGRLFACEHAGVSPDIMTLGKALTGGYMTLAAAVASARVAETISRGEPGVFMHGPTFMANPLACAVANASIELLLGSDWRGRVSAMERIMTVGLEPCRSLAGVADVRVLGGIGVVEMREPVAMRAVQARFVERGVWVRPFGRLIYLMPPFVIEHSDLGVLCEAVVAVVGAGS
jgi:adenosylmethionine-8-amino-7-oxononanoate aminotransferase